MMDCTDRHFRMIMRQLTRRSLLYTEMVVAQALHHGQRGRLLDFDPQERPLALQVGGDDPQLLTEAAQLAFEWGYDEINLNVGCPSPRVQQGNFGACLMADPERVARCVAAMAAAAPLPVTVKHRIGIDDRDSYAELLAFVDTVAAAGAARFAVHARKAWLQGLDPRQNRTIPPLRPDLVRALKRDRPQLTVELNGGLDTPAACHEALVGVDGVMVGRAAYHHPLRWWAVDREFFGAGATTNDGQMPEAIRPSTVIRGLLDYSETWCNSGGRLWAIARHLVHLVEGVAGSRRWRQQLTSDACTRGAGPELFERAARHLEAHGH